jgi:hypothetical protein
MFVVCRVFRIGAKPPFRNTLFERRLVVSGGVAYFENIEGARFNVFPETGSEWVKPDRPVQRKAP